MPVFPEKNIKQNDRQAHYYPKGHGAEIIQLEISLVFLVTFAGYIKGKAGYKHEKKQDVPDIRVHQLKLRGINKQAY